MRAVKRREGEEGEKHKVRGGEESEGKNIWCQELLGRSLGKEGTKYESKKKRKEGEKMHQVKNFEQEKVCLLACKSVKSVTGL